MAKFDDTNQIPARLTAPWLKRFFKNKLGIPVRVKNASSWVHIWIMSDSSHHHDHNLVYHHHFPAELGNRCMQLVYPASEKLRKQSWGGNIQAHSISLHSDHLRVLLRNVIDVPLAVE